MNYPLWLSIVLVLLIISCQQKKNESVIARTGDVELSLSEATRYIDSSRGSINGQLYKYAASWTNAELIYQEAKRSGIENSEEFNSQLQDTRRQLANQSFLEKMVYSKIPVNNDSALIEYYNAHSQEFFVREDMAKLNIALFDSRGQASTFAASINRGISWKDAIEKTSIEQPANSLPISVFSEKFYTQRTLFPSELWKIALTLGLNEVSFPIKTSLGFYIIQSLSFARKGDVSKFELIREDVRQRYIIEQRRKLYEELLVNLRKKYDVSILLKENQPTDSTQTQSNE
jgi:hypothetical protein